MNKVRAFITEKPDGEHRIVALFKNKKDDTYSFVNFTTGYIAPCKFVTEEDAIADLQNYLEDGRIKNFVEIKKVWFEYADKKEEDND